MQFPLHLDYYLTKKLTQYPHLRLWRSSGVGLRVQSVGERLAQNVGTRRGNQDDVLSDAEN
jgi:hypothetical protein